MANPKNTYILTDFSCCEDFEKYLRGQNHANRKLLDSLTEQVIGEWNRKACNLAIKGSNLCLLDKLGQTIAFVPAVLQDENTIMRDPNTGKISCMRIFAAGANKTVGVWLGTREQYKAIPTKNPEDTLYIFTDTNLSDVYDDLSTVKTWIAGVTAGTTVVPKASHAENATNATNAKSATNATNAAFATNATNATNARHAESATNARHAESATNATNAESASKASELDNNGTVFSRKAVWSGNKTIDAGSYADLYASEDVAGKYLIVETDRYRTYPMRFDTTKYTSATFAFLSNYIEVIMDDKNAKKVRVRNTSANSVTVSKIFVEL